MSTTNQLLKVDEGQILIRSYLMLSEFFPGSSTMTPSTFPKILHHAKKFSNLVDNKKKINRLKLMKLLQEQEALINNADEEWKKSVAQSDAIKTIAAILGLSREVNDDELKEEMIISKTIASKGVDQMTPSTAAPVERIKNETPSSSTSKTSTTDMSRVRVVRTLHQSELDKDNNTATTINGERAKENTTNEVRVVVKKTKTTRMARCETSKTRLTRIRKQQVQLRSEVRVVLERLSPKTLQKYQN